MPLSDSEKEQAAKALDWVTPTEPFNEDWVDILENLQRQLAKVGLAIQPISTLPSEFQAYGEAKASQIDREMLVERVKYLEAQIRAISGTEAK